MKKIVIILCLTFLFQFISSEENFQTVIELQIEKEYSEWLQEIITPYIGNNLVLIDLTLQYPQTGPSEFGKELDESITLPGFPVAKTSDDTALDVSLKSNYAKILSKKISIFLSDKIEQEELNYLKQQVGLWMNLDYTRGDEINLEQNSAFRPKNYYLYYIIAALLFLLILLNMRASVNYLGKALKKVNITGMDKVINVKGTLDNFGNAQYAKAATGSNELNFATDNPVPIKLIREKKKDKEKQINFHFLENLSVEDFNTILTDELPEVQAYLISQLKNVYIHNYLEKFPERSKLMLDSMLKKKTLEKSQILDVLKRIKQKFSDINEIAAFSYDSKDVLVKILNALPIENAVNLINELKENDLEVLEHIRSKILLPEDVLTLEPDFIKMLIRTIDRDILIPYIASQSLEIQTFFYNHMTERSVAIIKDEIDSLGKMSENDKNEAVSVMINKIREILFHNMRKR